MLPLRDLTQHLESDLVPLQCLNRFERVNGACKSRGVNIGHKSTRSHSATAAPGPTPAAHRDGLEGPGRLCHRFRRLRAPGLHHNKVCAAIARELCGFIRDIGRRRPAEHLICRILARLDHRSFSSPVIVDPPWSRCPPARMWTTRKMSSSFWTIAGLYGA